jgi:hypothetical protein
VFEPLLLEEAGAQVLRGIEEGYVIEPHPAVVAACSKVRHRGQVENHCLRFGGRWLAHDTCGTKLVKQHGVVCRPSAGCWHACSAVAWVSFLPGM